MSQSIPSKAKLFVVTRANEHGDSHEVLMIEPKAQEEQEPTNTNVLPPTFPAIETTAGLRDDVGIHNSRVVHDDHPSVRIVEALEVHEEFALRDTHNRVWCPLGKFQTLLHQNPIHPVVMTVLQNEVSIPTQRPTVLFSPHTSRQGRHQQRYHRDGARHITVGICTDDNKRVLLVQSTSKGKDKWVLPKGGWDSDETMEESVLREVWEEGGVRGVVAFHVDTFCHTQEEKGTSGVYDVFVVLVSGIAEVFPEGKHRSRMWVPYEEAVRMMCRPELGKFLQHPKVAEYFKNK
eukprot:PhF_6_TR42898/c0_g1_i3/m.64998/K07766/E3.6.1.52; diphosphoinositol-polyphosphate diphosphatase